MPFSNSPTLRIVASVFATIAIGFGINAAINPASNLAFFELPYPSLPAEQKLVDAFSVAYGARDVFIGLAIYAAAAYGDRRALGWILVASGGCAGVDGAVCRFMVGKGEMNHWSYAPLHVLNGAALLGLFDGK